MGVHLSVCILVLFSVQRNAAFSLGNMGGKASKQTLRAAAPEQPRVPVPAASVVAKAGPKEEPSPDVHGVGPDAASTASAGTVSDAVAVALRETRAQTPEPSQDTAESTNTTEGALRESIKSTNEINTSNTTKTKKTKMEKRVKGPKGSKPLKRVLDARSFLSYRILHYPDLTSHTSHITHHTSTPPHTHTSHFTPHIIPHTLYLYASGRKKTPRAECSTGSTSG
jgi:hypothetical protein